MEYEKNICGIIFQKAGEPREREREREREGEREKEGG